MRVCCLASGSKGNCTYVESDNCKILIDIGITTKDAEERLRSIGVEPCDIDAVLITHEHSDHIGGLKIFIGKHHIPVYVHISGMKAVTSRQDIPLNLQISFLEESFAVKDMVVTPFRLSHDSACCVGYSVSANGAKMSIMTDTGVVSEYAIDVMSGSDIIIIESNHNKQMLLDNPNYSLFLKKRILSTQGHLSNEECAYNILKCLTKAYTTQFVLAHLSEHNNTPVVAFNEVTSILKEHGVVEGRDIYIDIAMQYRVGHVFEIKDREC